MLYPTLAALGLIAALAALSVGLALVLRTIRRLAKDEFAGLYGRYYGYRAPLNPDPLVPLPLAVELHLLQSPWRRHPRAIWQNTSLAKHGFVTGRAVRNAEGFTVILDEGANLPFVISLFDLTSAGMPEIKVGIQSGVLATLKYPYAATVLFSRQPLDQLVASAALKRFGAFGITLDGAREVAERALRTAQAR